MNDKKRHHFISQTYLRSFGRQDGKLCVYSKDKPARPWWAATDTIAFENYYYSQPTPDGGQDNNRLEDHFSSIENGWRSLVAKLGKREIDVRDFENLLLFTIVHRVRVPTARDASERMLAESVRMTARHLNDHNLLPPPPANLTFDELDRMMVVSIDPHKSIHAMVDFAKGFGTVLSAVGFEILENETEEKFVTSDNPVIYFDPSLSTQSLQPYNIDRTRMEIELIFPVTPRLALWGHSKLKEATRGHRVPAYRSITDKHFVRRANVLSARFAHRFLFAQEDRHQRLIAKYASTSPVLSVRHVRTGKGRGIFGQMVFGARTQKPKWPRPIQQARRAV